ncbi:MAG TPA: hypothetical protein VE891_03535, partial [Allosphingosinicella sp.]|nr:hypothetical protein [Allosphingosinicella sp.]
MLALALGGCDLFGGSDGDKIAAAPVPCLPEGAPSPFPGGGQAQTQTQAPAAAAPRVYIDGSLSMAG